VAGRGGQTWSTDMSTLIGIGFFGLPSNPENSYYSHKFGVHLGNSGEVATYLFVRLVR
jgi:hypothetical protein